MGTLFECLREARLEKYYPSFRAHGITRSENLTRLSVHDCVSFGINSAEDKRRLVELISIVKAVHNTDTYQTPSSSSASSRSSQQSRNKVPRKRNRSPAHPAFQVSGRGLTVTNDIQVRDRSRSNANSQQHVSQVGGVVLDLLSDESSESDSGQSSEHSDYEPAVKHSVSASVSRVTPPRIRKTPVEKVKHGQGYNYGVPGGASSSTARPKSRGRPGEEKIKVCVRKRPLSKRELKAGEENMAKALSTTTLAVNEPKQAVDLTAYVLSHEFIFDEVFDEDCTNEDVYIRAARPLISCIFDGGNATCFAYGQTGAGKTHTMIGSREIPGLYLLAAHDIFSIIESGQYGAGLRVWISFFEIYCGQLFDLLNKRNRLHAREDGSQRVCLAGLTETEVNDETSLMQVLEYGNAVRSKGATGVNPDSSRSHAVLQLEIRDGQDRKMGRISFIDLAGSERASDVTDTDKQTRMEGAEINQSLLALKECIRSIDQESRHKPFRQSKLTHILKESFVGNSRTCMIANISPAKSSCEHTLNTLRYADRVKELKKNTAQATNRSVNVAMSNILMNIPASAPQAPSLFQPSNILCSSTPMRQGSRQFNNRGSSADLNLDPSETPLRGPGARRKTAASVSKSASNQRSSVNSSVSSRASAVRHVAVRQNESSHSDSDLTDTDSCNVTGPQPTKFAAGQSNIQGKAKQAGKKALPPSASKNIPVAKSTDTDNDFPTTDFNNDDEVVMNDLNRTGGKEAGLSQAQTVAASVPTLPAGLTRPTGPTTGGGNSSYGQGLGHISSVSASTPLLRQKQYIEKQSMQDYDGDQMDISRGSDMNGATTAGTRLLRDPSSNRRAADMIAFQSSSDSRVGSNPRLLPSASSSNIPTSNFPAMSSENVPSHKPPEASTATQRPKMTGTLTSSFEDDMLFDGPSTNPELKKQHSRTPSDSSAVFSPNSTRVQPKVPQDPSSDPEIPPVLPAKSSDLTTFSQWTPGSITSPRWLLHNPNQGDGPSVGSAGVKDSTPVTSNYNTGSKPNSQLPSYLTNQGTSLKALREKHQLLGSGNSSRTPDRGIPSRDVHPNFEYPILKGQQEDKKTEERKPASRSTKSGTPSTLSNYRNDNPSAKTYSERLASDAGSNREGSPLSFNLDSGEPISANWYQTPADHDTHVSQSVTKKTSGALDRLNLRSKVAERDVEQTQVKNIDNDLPEYLPIQRNSPKTRSIHSDSGVVSNTSSTSRVSMTTATTTSATGAAGSSSRFAQSNYFPPLDQFADSGARPKYASQSRANVVHSPVLNRQAFVSSPVSKEILSHSPVIVEAGDSVSPRDVDRNVNSPACVAKASGGPALKTEKLKAGSVFSPIHPQPVTSDRLTRSTSAVSKDIVHPTPVSQTTASVDSRQDLSNGHSSSDTGDESIDLKNQLISAHEDQLATVTSLCKQEMKLLLGAKAGSKVFDDYMQKVNEVLTQKMSAIQLLQDQIMAYQLSTQDASM